MLDSVHGGTYCVVCRVHGGACCVLGRVLGDGDRHTEGRQPLPLRVLCASARAEGQWP